MSAFIYVFDELARDMLLDKQYVLLRSDETRHIYTFANQDRMDFTDCGMQFVYSDTLSF